MGYRDTDVPMSDVSIALPDRYRVLNRIATGGMATVYRAEDGILGREVAVKILAPHVAADPTSRARFEREARTAARVGDHPNVVTIYDIGEMGENAFIVMELYRGGTVADRLRDATTVPRKQALGWLSEAAAGLDYAHSREVVHRDVKPANLLLDESGRLGVGDFGIARLADESSLTQAGTVLGTAAYLSPEQATGEGATAASDRYSLGCVAFELLTGRRPFTGEHAAAQARQHVESPMPDTGLGPHVDEVMGRALAKDPDERYPTCALFIEELEHAVARAGAQRPDPPTEPTRRAVAPVPERPPTPTPPRRLEPQAAAPVAATDSPRSNRGWIALAAVAAVALAVAAIALLGGGDENGGDDSAQRDTPKTQESKPREEPAQTAQTPPATEEQPPPETTPPDNEPEEGPGPAAGSESPGELNDRGFAALQAGDAESAVPLLEQSVAGYEEQGGAAPAVPYGYALFNLGDAYMATGRPAEAAEMYQRRLDVSPDDRPEIVKKKLKEAEKAAKKAG